MILVQYHKYAYRHFFSGAINMCCDLWALDLTSHTCLLLAEACFKSVTSVLSRTDLVSRPYFTPPNQHKPNNWMHQITSHWPIFMVATWFLIGWWQPSMMDSPLHCPNPRGVWGCHWKHAIFYIFAPCHQIRMRCSDHCSLCSWFFSVVKRAKKGVLSFECETHWGNNVPKPQVA